MLALLQRVTSANVIVDGEIIGEIQQGLLVFVGVEPQDNSSITERLVERVLGYRIFADENDKMNLNVTDIAGELLIIPQFTLVADTKKGMRPSFSSVASPKIGENFFNYFLECCEKKYSKEKISRGKFGADMQINLCNNGPATFILHNLG